MKTSRLYNFVISVCVCAIIWIFVYAMLYPPLKPKSEPPTVYALQEQLDRVDKAECDMRDHIANLRARLELTEATMGELIQRKHDAEMRVDRISSESLRRAFMPETTNNL